MLRQPLLQAIVHHGILSLSRLCALFMGRKCRLYGIQDWRFLSVLWRQFVKLDFQSSTVPYNGSGHGIRTVKQWSRWARCFVDSLHRDFKTRPDMARNNLVWPQNWSCFEQKVALEASWGPFQSFIILGYYVSGGNPPKLDISRISSYRFAKEAIQIPVSLTFPLLWYWMSSKRWLYLWV